MATITFDPATEAAARGAMYSLLARFWLREVESELLRELNTLPLRDAFMEAGGVLPSGNDEATMEQLAIDYCRLFVGPIDHLPPFQSVWKSGQFHGAPIESMKHFIDVVGYDVRKLPRGMMLDHLGLQFAVMGHILCQVATWPTEREGLNTVLELSDSFFATHLQWPIDLLDAAASRATTEFYRSAIVLSRDFLNSEAMPKTVKP